jgi:very-short-patch-repair endonuclease/Mrp family chromosome partitioning ATPase
VSSNDLEEKVLDHLRRSGPAKANQIARALGVNRLEVNSALYGQLRGAVKQSKDYTWSLIESGTTTRKPTTWETPNTNARLFKYYLDCLTQDDDSGVEVLADSENGLDYIEIEQWPLEEGHIDTEPEALRRLIGLQRAEARKKALWLGYPTLIRQARSRSGREGAFLSPLLLWPADPDTHELAFLPEPAINTKALEKLTCRENLLEEAAWLAEELGLDSVEEAPIDELASRLRELRPEWSWKEQLDPTSLRLAGELRSVTETGIFNAAVVVLADRSPFTVGLERELANLQTVSDASIKASSLGVLLGETGSPAEISGPLLEPIPLNAEQRMATRQALTAPLTVVTGPPGTGKSQVVASILVNAAWRGLRVLFASKNNKAVEVVLEKMNSLSPQPIMLRLGTRSLQEELANKLTAILSARVSEEERNDYVAALTALQNENASLESADRKVEELIGFRNQLDRCEMACEGARGLLPDRVFRDADQIPSDGLEDGTEQLEQAIRRADRSNAPFLEKLVWKLLEKSRQQQIKVAAEAVIRDAEQIGVHLPISSPPDRLLASGRDLIRALKQAAGYRAALKRFSNEPQLGSIAKQIANQNRKVAALSTEAWRNWTLLLPDRLKDPRDRAALGDYAGILRTIARTEEEGGNIQAQVWRRYYDLASKTAKALPCWAVTSLSARGRVPFTAAEFDLLVVDEASQCDIASALPLLYRAKRAVVIGDPQQLRHISHLSAQRDQALLVKHDLLTIPGPSWGYRANGLYDLAASKAGADSIVALRDHHRSHADIISFSNEFFYRGKLRVATDYGRLKRLEGPAVRWISVKGEVIRPSSGGAVNRVEAEAVVRELKRIAVEQRFPGEIGVVTPFRAQANLIQEIANSDNGLARILASRNFLAETAHVFQGDERDLIIFSPVVSNGMPPGAHVFLRSQGNIFNVGITRARGSLIVVGDARACASSDVEYLRAFVHYVERLSAPMETRTMPSNDSNGEEYPAVARPELVSEWERAFYPALVQAGYRPIPQFHVDHYLLDFALIRPNGRKLDIEIDGERYHRDWDGELIRKDQLRNLRLIEMGWDILRLWVYEVRDNHADCIMRVKRWVEEADSLPELKSLRPRED